MVGSASRIGGRYTVEATLGRGGMGEVYRVHDEVTTRTLALKRLSSEGEDELARLRFRREFHTIASFSHPRIVDAHDFGVDGTPYYTMELLDGRDLAELDRVPWQTACALLRDVASALAFLHSRRLLHRDLAPRNVRCTSDGRAKLIDFGLLATSGVAGELAGTPPFMAIEAVHGRPLDHRYDLFGLGALAYRILTGLHAYPAKTIAQIEGAWREQPPSPASLVPGLPPELDELVVALLAPDPLARPASATDVIDRLNAIAKLDASPETTVAHGWIASAALVGRRREIAQIRRAAQRAHAGSGRSLLLEAPSGTGKTRLLREIALEAQLAGMTVVKTSEPTKGPYAVVRELAHALLAVVPERAINAARGRAPLLARVVPQLGERLHAQPAPLEGDPAEDRMRVQQAAVGWFEAIAADHSIALCIDDVQRCDEGSAAVLAALAHGASTRRLLIASALRSDEPVHAPGAIAALVDAGQRVRLRGITAVSYTHLTLPTNREV